MLIHSGAVWCRQNSLGNSRRAQVAAERRRHRAFWFLFADNVPRLQRHPCTSVHAGNLIYYGNGVGSSGAPMKSSIVKRSVVIGGHKTSVSLEEPFWIDLKEIACAQHVTLSALITKIDGTREQSNLSSAIRLFVLRHSRLAQSRGHYPRTASSSARQRARAARSGLR